MNRPIRRKVCDARLIRWPADLRLTGLLKGADRGLGTLTSPKELGNALAEAHKKESVIGWHVTGTDDANNDVFLPEIKRVY